MHKQPSSGYLEGFNFMYHLMPMDTIWVHCLCFYSKSSAPEISTKQNTQERPDKMAATNKEF